MTTLGYRGMRLIYLEPKTNPRIHDQSQSRVFEAYMMMHEEMDTHELILAFRGSDSLPTLMLNFDPRSVCFRTLNSGDSSSYYYSYSSDSSSSYSSVFCHRGYFLRYLSASEEVRLIVRDFLKNYGDRATKITVTGHSLGGTCATLCAMDISDIIEEHRQQQMINTTSLDVVTFGTPPFASKAFCDSVDAIVPCTRVVNVGDPVPALTLYYRQHNGTEILVPGPLLDSHDRASGRKQRECTSSVDKQFNAKLTPSALVHNHMSKTYVRNLLYAKKKISAALHQHREVGGPRLR